MSLPETYIPVIRPDDGERTGYVALVDSAWLPLNLVGFALGDPTDRDSAQQLVIRQGLASLDGTWWCRAPKPFPATESELRNPKSDWTWRKVVIVEVDAVGCTLRPALAWPEEASVVTRLTLPVDDVLRARPDD